MGRKAGPAFIVSAEYSATKNIAYWEVFPSVILEASGSSGSTLSATKSSNEGPAASFVENVGVAFGTAVAKHLSPEEAAEDTRAALNAKRQTCMMVGWCGMGAA
jgi:hypothetical protein